LGVKILFAQFVLLFVLEISSDDFFKNYLYYTYIPIHLESSGHRLEASYPFFDFRFELFYVEKMTPFFDTVFFPKRWSVSFCTTVNSAD